MLLSQTHHLKASSAGSLPKLPARFHLKPQGQLFPPCLKSCPHMSLSETHTFSHLFFHTLILRYLCVVSFSPAHLSTPSFLQIFQVYSLKFLFHGN